MPVARSAQNLSGLLKELRAVRHDSQEIRVADILGRLGTRSFGPLLLLAALPTLTPISTIPGVAIVGAVIVALAAGQLLLGFERLWLPNWLLQQQLGRATLERALRWIGPVTSLVDRLVRPRWSVMLERPGLAAIAVCCLMLTVVMFPLQLVPFTSGIPSFPVALFGLALIARDGLLALIGFVSAAVVLLGSASLLVFGSSLF